ncbi:hypothetical protein [Streptomyces parvus]|uniref:hypothetical protein n=1 Tax=Streptomyces parvus TaxID=66428 RepID=UPI0033C8C7F9
MTNEPNVRIRVHKSVTLSADALELLLDAALYRSTAGLEAIQILREHNGRERLPAGYATAMRPDYDPLPHISALEYLRTRLA